MDRSRGIWRCDKNQRGRIKDWESWSGDPLCKDDDRNYCNAWGSKEIGEKGGEACRHQRDKGTPTARGKRGCEAPLKNLLSYADFKGITGSQFWWISVVLQNLYTEYLMCPQAQHRQAGSYKTTRALLKVVKVTQPSLWDFTSTVPHPSDEQAARCCHTDTQRPSDASLCLRQV